MRRLLRSELDELDVYVTRIAATRGIPPAHIEKDFWVTELLRGAAAASRATGCSLVFKGGTSLSKAHHLIERFSEDVDLIAVLPAGGAKAKDSALKAFVAGGATGRGLDRAAPAAGPSHAPTREPALGPGPAPGPGQRGEVVAAVPDPSLPRGARDGRVTVSRAPTRRRSALTGAAGTGAPPREAALRRGPGRRRAPGGAPTPSPSRALASRACSTASSALIAAGTTPTRNDGTPPWRLRAPTGVRQ